MKKLMVIVLILAFVVVMAYAGDTGKACSEACKVKCAGMAAAGQTAGTDNEAPAAANDTKAAATEAKDAHAGCEAKAAGEVMKTEEAPAAVINGSEAAVTATSATPKIPESCPDTKDQPALETFHGAMSPMHMALEDGRYAEMRERCPELLKASEGLKTYNCPMGDKCPPECKKGFEGKKAELLKSIEAVGLACKGTDDKAVEASFITMHEAYVSFASMCKPAPAAEEKK